MGEIKDFEDPLLKDMIRFRTLSILFFLELVWYSKSLKIICHNTDFKSHTLRKLKFF